jgi:anti-sigma28 factor (negative regulator of flagellin synthesis)
MRSPQLGPSTPSAMEGQDRGQAARWASRRKPTMNKIGNRKGPATKKNASRKPVKLPGGRKLDISPEQVEQWVEKAKQQPETRRELVERVKAQIQAGTYETPEKLEIAARRLLEDLLGQ